MHRQKHNKKRSWKEKKKKKSENHFIFSQPQTQFTATHCPHTHESWILTESTVSFSFFYFYPGWTLESFDSNHNSRRHVIYVHILRLLLYAFSCCCILFLLRMISTTFFLPFSHLFPVRRTLSAAARQASPHISLNPSCVLLFSLYNLSERSIVRH